MSAQVIDEARRAMRRENQGMETLKVLATLKDKLPEVWEIAEVVGKWVWVEFPMPPAAQVREALLDLGFHWNHTRKAWQHACGCYAHKTNGNPRWKYAVVPAIELQEAAA